MSPHRREFTQTLPGDPHVAEVDATDLELIDHLRLDGRVPYTELARRMQVTEKTVRRRVARLLDAGCITIAAVTDPRSLGFHCMALLLLTVDGSRLPTDIAGELMSVPEVNLVTVTCGPFAVAAQLVCTDRQELHDIAFGTIGSVPGVTSVEVLPYLRVPPRQARFPDADGLQPHPLDDTDREIIAHLATDGRASFRDFASGMGFSEATVRLRYAKLVEAGAVRVMCLVHPLRLGYRATSWVGVRIGEQGRAQDVADALAQLDAVSCVAVTAGRFDVLAEVVATTDELLLALLDNDIRTISGISGVETWPYLDVSHKMIRARRTKPEPLRPRDIQTG